MIFCFCEHLNDLMIQWSANDWMKKLVKEFHVQLWKDAKGDISAVLQTI